MRGMKRTTIDSKLSVAGQPSPAEIAAPQSFYLTWPARQPLKPEAEILRDWLLAQAA